MHAIMDETNKKGSVTCISDLAECDLLRMGLNNLHVCVTDMLIISHDNLEIMTTSQS